MKYYGSIYRGIAGSYDASSMQAYDDPYAAMLAANAEWNADPSLQIPRLLLVIRVADSEEPAVKNDRAYFQFCDSPSADRFAKERSKIMWSTEDCPLGNGNFGEMW